MDDQVRHLFDELADLPAKERERVLNQRQIEPDVRVEVESLLNYDSDEHQPLTRCVAAAAEDLLRLATDRETDSCGPYRLVRLLGTGGMGTVYLGERTDGEIQQKVAIKLLSGDRPDWQERFLRERQLLASLNHSSIVRVIDAGHTGSGRPFLVMEYVEGIPIDEYASRIGVRERLLLFLRVCEGVAHAHRRLIIHRDLKPSNILVDESGQPKLLDFGIAKLVDESNDVTRTADRLLTPKYASPEQIHCELQTTATDIYSLGAVLYKLLTGQSPNENQSTKSAQILAPSSLNPNIPGDLDYVLRKSLRFEPEERYASVEAFAKDIQAVLELRPVEARGADAWYRTRKFLRRYWVPVGAGALAIAGLSGGLYVANHERVIAERRFNQLRNLSTKVFDLDSAIRNLPGSTEARQQLVSAALDYLGGLSADVHGDPDLAQEIAEGYWRIGRMQGVPVELNLGETAKAEASLQKAEEMIEAALAAHPNNRRVLDRAASIAQDRMILAQQVGRNTEAVADARLLTQRLDAFLSREEASEVERRNAAGVYGNVALAYLNMHMYAGAIPYARKTVEISRSLPSARYRVGQGLSLLANALRYQGDLEGALQSIEEARGIAEQAAYPNATARMIDLYGIFLREGYILGEDGDISLNRPADAIAAFEKAFNLAEEAAVRDPNDAVSRARVGNSGVALGNVTRASDPQRALAVYDLAYQRLMVIRNSLVARRDAAGVLANSSYALRLLHRPGEAKQRIDNALAILRRPQDPQERLKLDSDIFVALRAQADYEAAAGDPRRAQQDYEFLLTKVLAENSQSYADLRDAPGLSRLYEALAEIYHRTGDAVKSQDMNQRRKDIWEYWDRKIPGNPFVRDQLQAASRPL